MKFLSLVVLSGLLTVSCAHKKDCGSGHCPKDQQQKSCCKEKKECCQKKEACCAEKEKLGCTDGHCKKTEEKKQ